jgi:hypothetical protein
MFTKWWMPYVLFCMQLNAQRFVIFEGTTNNAAMHRAFSYSSQTVRFKKLFTPF